MRPAKRVRRRLEDVRRGQVAFGHRTVGFHTVDKRGDLAALGRVRHVLHDQVQNQVAADIVVRRSAHHRENAQLPHTLPHAFQDVVHGKRALLEELLHVRIVAFGHDFDQDFMRLLRLFGLICRDFRLFPLAVAIRRIEERLHPNQVDNALELALAADRQMDRYRRTPEKLLYARQRPLKIGAFPIQLINHHRARQLELRRKGPDLLGLHFDSRYSVHQYQGGIGGHQRSPRIVDEDVVAGSVQNVDLVLFPLGHGNGGRDRDFALDLLLVKICDRVALIDSEKAIGSSGGEKQRGSERGLAGIAVAHYTNVPDIFAFVDFHGVAPFLKRNSNTRIHRVASGRRYPSRQLSHQPGARHLPIPHHALRRDLEHFRRLLHRQSAEKTHLDHPRFSRIQLGQRF